MLQGKNSHMKDRRIELLESVGFAWDGKAVWPIRISELCAFLSKHGHLDIPDSGEHAKLAAWAKNQRLQHRLRREGKRSTMTGKKEGELNSLGFKWEDGGASRGGGEMPQRAGAKSDDGGGGGGATRLL